MHGLSAGKGLVICGIYGLVASTMDNKFYLWGRSSGVTWSFSQVVVLCDKFPSPSHQLRTIRIQDDID